MNVSPETTMAIGFLASLLTQVVKRALPGNVDPKGVEINIVAALIASGLWMYQNAPTMFVQAPFDAALLWAGVVIAATGGYKVMRMQTDTSKPANGAP